MICNSSVTLVHYLPQYFAKILARMKSRVRWQSLMNAKEKYCSLNEKDVLYLWKT